MKKSTILLVIALSTSFVSAAVNDSRLLGTWKPIVKKTMIQNMRCDSFNIIEFGHLYKRYLNENI